MHINYWDEVKRSKYGRTGLIMIGIVFFVGVFGPLISPYDPWDYMGATLRPPSLKHPLGLNDTGQDILSELIYGTRTTLLIGTVTAVLSTFISMVLGVSAAIRGGVFDRVTLRAIDIMLVIPVFLVAVLAASFFRPGVVVMIVLLTLLLWPPGARIIRMQTLSLLKNQHLEAAANFGAGKSYIVFKHIVPDLFPILSANFIQVIRRAIFMEAGLAFLGVFDPALKSWGLMIHYAREYIFTGAWVWWLLPAGFAISFTIIGFTFLGYALESILDPRLRRFN